MFQRNRIFSYSEKEIHIILKSAFADFREIESYFGVANSMYTLYLEKVRLFPKQ